MVWERRKTDILSFNPSQRTIFKVHHKKTWISFHTQNISQHAREAIHVSRAQSSPPGTGERRRHQMRSEAEANRSRWFPTAGADALVLLSSLPTDPARNSEYKLSSSFLALHQFKSTRSWGRELTYFPVCLHKMSLKADKETALLGNKNTTKPKLRSEHHSGVFLWSLPAVLTELQFCCKLHMHLQPRAARDC